MKCTNCGKYLAENANFCNNCGEPVKNNHESQFNYSTNYNYITSNINSSDEEYIKTYIGPNYEKISKNKFSIPTLFLGVYHLLYRKMWLAAIGWIILNFLSMIFIKKYNIILSIAINIIMGLNFSKLYLEQTQTKVEQIKQQNLDKTNQEILQICRKKGGVSVIIPIVTACILFAISFIYSFSTGIYTIYKEELKTNPSTTTPNIEELTYTIPEGFNISEYSTDNYKYYSYIKETDYCNITVETYDYASAYDSVEDFLNSVIYINPTDKSTSIISKNINNTEWKLIEINSTHEKKYQYATIYNDKIYNIKYSIIDNYSNICEEGHNKFIKTLTFSTKRNNSL